MKASAAAKIALVGLAVWLAMQSPALAASIALTPNHNHPGATIKVKGGHFGANEPVDVYFDSTDELLVATNSRGAFRNHNLPVPADALPGQHWVTAVGRNSGLAAEAPFSVSTDWATFHFANDRSGVNPYENVLTASNVSGLSLDWSVPIKEDAFVDSSPVIANGILYVGAHDPNSTQAVFAYDASNGALLWSASVATALGAHSPPTVANGVVYIGAETQLYAFDASTGAQLWVADTQNSIYASPAVANGVVFVGSIDDHIYAFNASTGAKLWSADTGPIYGSPAVVNGVVYVAADSEVTFRLIFYAFDASTGALLWDYSTGEDAGLGAPAVENGVVYFTTLDYVQPDIFALNASTGELLWSEQTGTQIRSAPAVANGVVYIQTYGNGTYVDNYVCAISGGIGSWCTDIGAGSQERAGGVIEPSPAVANGVVYAASDGGTVYALDASSGAVLWTSPNLGGSILASPAVTNGMVFINTGAFDYNTTLNAFALNGGKHYGSDRRAADIHGLQPDWRLTISN